MMFNLEPDYRLNIMKQEQDLFYITQSVLEKTKQLFKELNPSMVIVQGDTTSAVSAALAAYYLKIPVAHVEAGLRTYNRYRPFPEEMNRRLISQLSTYHFTPTKLASQALISEGFCEKNIFCTGNTVVDALWKIKQRIEKGELKPSESLQNLISYHRQAGHQIFLLTAHRRESLENGLGDIFSGVKTALQRYPALQIIYPKHPNPLIQTVLKQAQLESESNISILPPLDYCDMVYLLINVDGVLTDSGGIQEEAISLNKPTLVLRKETDRPEGVIAGIATLVGTDTEAILAGIDRLMSNNFHVTADLSIYGDGAASEYIAKIIKNHLKLLEEK
jgi:UDP-N-acetylglucosamine 2-epimerase (non-hydrolysing)